jgi:hypothetical protein
MRPLARDQHNGVMFGFTRPSRASRRSARLAEQIRQRPAVRSSLSAVADLLADPTVTISFVGGLGEGQWAHLDVRRDGEWTVDVNIDRIVTGGAPSHRSVHRTPGPTSD